ncbi:MAG TPA: hypothetical protein VN750_08620 [Steroidobacteraceae bacterium]|nr:hypothetical protein [Steroidobacteraceae bacterium]
MAFVLNAVLGGAQVAHAAGWDFNPRVQVGGLYNDNYRLAEDDADRVHAAGALLDASLAMRWLTQRSELSLEPRLTGNYFANDSRDDSTNGYLDLTGKTKTLRATYGMTVQYANEEVIFSELLPANFPGVELGQIVGSQSGRVTELNRRELESVTPTMTYDFSPRYHLNLDANYLHVAYDKNIFEESGFQNYQLRGGLAYDISQKTTLTGSLIGTRYEPNGGVEPTNGFGGETQLTFHPTQIIRYYFRLGALRSQAQVNGGTVGTTSITGGAGVTWTYQITQFVLDGLRGVAPSAEGAVQNHTELRFRVIRALKPRLSAFVGARGIRLRGTVGGPFEIQGSDYVAATTGLQYQLTRNYRLAGEYDYTWQRFQGEPRAASNAFTISVIYQPPSRYEPLPDFNGLPVGLPQ